MLFVLSCNRNPIVFAEKQFWDVSTNHWAYDEVHFLSTKSIINGFPDGSFKPNQTITRLQAMMIILRAKDLHDFSDVTNPGFIDIQEGDYGYEIIAKAAQLGIISGKYNEDGEKVFDPAGTLTRSQMATILVNAYNLQGSTEINYFDVQKSHWAYEKIQIVTANKIAMGYENGLFGANDSITRAQFSVMMARILGYTPKEVVQASKQKVPVTNMLLPEESSHDRTTPITHIVIHFTSNVSANQNNPYNVEFIKRIFINYGVSAHYLIDRDGEIYRLVSENRVAYHAGKGELPRFPNYKNRLNEYSIGIELLAIGTQDEMKSMIPKEKYQSIRPEHIGYTEAQYTSLKRLLDDIVERNPSIQYNRTHIIGHDEYAPTRKTDPGELFQWWKLGF